MYSIIRESEVAVPSIGAEVTIGVIKRRLRDQIVIKSTLISAEVIIDLIPIITELTRVNDSVTTWILATILIKAMLISKGELNLIIDTIPKALIIRWLN